MRSVLHTLFKSFGLSVSRFDDKQYSRRKNFFRHKAVYEKYKAYTMIPLLNYLDNLEIASMCAAVKGDVVECGVWKGGMIAGVSEILGTGRKYWLFDSFEGLPPARQKDGRDALEWQNKKDGEYYYDNCTADPRFAEEVMQLAGAADYSIVKGWFSDTLPSARIEKIALLRLDGDWYDSTMTCLDNLYHRVADGGIVIIDDYYFWEGCARAVHDFLSKNDISDRIEQTENGVAYIVKNKKFIGFN